MRAPLFALFLAACGPSAPPPATQPANPWEEQARAAASQSQAQSAQMMQTLQAQQEQERQLQVQTAIAAQQQGAALMAAEDERRRKEDADVRARQEAQRRAHCDGTRSERVAKARDYARAWVAFIKRVGPNLKTIRTACVMRDSTGTRIETERDGKGTIVRMHAVGRPDDVKCNGLPKGVDLEDVRFVLYGLDETYLAGALLDEPEMQNDNATCLDLDKAAGFDTSVKRSDADGVKKLAGSQ